MSDYVTTEHQRNLRIDRDHLTTAPTEELEHDHLTMMTMACQTTLVTATTTEDNARLLQYHLRCLRDGFRPDSHSRRMCHVKKFRFLTRLQMQ